MLVNHPVESVQQIKIKLHDAGTLVTAQRVMQADCKYARHSAMKGCVPKYIILKVYYQ
jgi:hypothetical protein